MAVKRAPSPPADAAGTSAKAQKSSVQSLAKGLRILEIFTADDEPLTVTEIAERAELDPGTAFRMLNTLVALGYVTRYSGTDTTMGLMMASTGWLFPFFSPLIGEKLLVFNPAMQEGTSALLDASALLAHVMLFFQRYLAPETKE